MSKLKLINFKFTRINFCLMCWTTTAVYYTDKYWTNTLASFLEIKFKPHLYTSSACVNFCGFRDIKVKLVVWNYNSIWFNFSVSSKLQGLARNFFVKLQKNIVNRIVNASIRFKEFLKLILIDCFWMCLTEWVLCSVKLNLICAFSMYLIFDFRCLCWNHRIYIFISYFLIVN